MYIISSNISIDNKLPYFCRWRVQKFICFDAHRFGALETYGRRKGRIRDMYVGIFLITEKFYLLPSQSDGLHIVLFITYTENTLTIFLIFSKNLKVFCNFLHAQGKMVSTKLSIQ